MLKRLKARLAALVVDWLLPEIERRRDQRFREAIHAIQPRAVDRFSAASKAPRSA